MAIYRYSRLSEQIPAQVEEWSVQEVKADQFEVRAHLSYTFQGETYHHTLPVGRRYPNPWAAEKAMQQLKGKSEWKIWIDPKRPEEGVIDKYFPYRATISALILVGIMIYFLFLGLYARSK